MGNRYTHTSHLDQYYNILRTNHGSLALTSIVDRLLPNKFLTLFVIGILRIIETMSLSTDKGGSSFWLYSSGLNFSWDVRAREKPKK